MRRYRSLKNKKPMKGRAERGALDAREKQEREDRKTARARSEGRCEVAIDVGNAPWLGITKTIRFQCERAAADIHHVVKRSQGGKFKGPDYLMAICRFHHDLTDAASTARSFALDGEFRHGRLRIAAEGKGKFRCWMETAAKTTTDRAEASA